jgi:hypothetical protein
MVHKQNFFKSESEKIKDIKEFKSGYMYAIKHRKTINDNFIDGAKKAMKDMNRLR